MSGVEATVSGMHTSGAQESPRFVYVPWNDELSIDSRASHVFAVARDLASKERLPVMGIAATKDQLPDGWGKFPYRTRKSSVAAIDGPAVRIYFWPSLDDLASMAPASSGFVIVLEWQAGELAGWARHNHALNFDTREELVTARSDAAMELYERIERNGNNGWHDDWGTRDAINDMRKLRDLGEFDVLDLAGYMIGRRGSRAIRQLLQLARGV